MKPVFLRVARIVVAAGLAWSTAAVCRAFHTNRAIVAMALLLEIVAVATLGDWVLSVLMSAVASMAFRWYFIDTLGSLVIQTADGALNFLTMVVTALMVSLLAIRGRRQADEAQRSRGEMVKLQRLAGILLTPASVAEAAAKAAEDVVGLFGLNGALIRRDSGKEFHFGSTAGETSEIALECGSKLILYGAQPSLEVRSALAQVIGLALDRARNMEENTRRETAKRSEELHTTVLNALAHNFRTPLTSIKAAASMLRGASDLPTAQDRELVSIIDEEADRLDRLIGESLDLARIEAHRVSPRIEECAVPDIVNAVSARVGRYLGNREFAVSLPGGLPMLKGDRFLFEQMLMQVVDNAWKYSKPGARIEIAAAASDGQVLLTVRNEGSLIPDDEREQIFAKFYRGASNHSHVEGTGLGLAIARSIAEAHGGSVRLNAEPAGPAFQFSLPVEVNGD